MDVFLLIFKNIIFPLFSTIGLGVLLHRKFKFDLNTVSKLCNYVFLPAVCFVNIYKGELSWNLVLLIVGFQVLLNLLLIAVSTCYVKLNCYESGLSASFKNSMVLSNSGNFGLPVSELVFQGNPLGLSIQVIISVFQNILTFTYGLFNAVSGTYSGRKIFLEMAKMPVLYALFLAFLMRIFNLDIPEPVWKPIQNLSNAFLAIALITLGAQIAYLQIKKINSPLVISIIGRLVLSPIIALFIIWLLQLEGIVAQALLIASSFPTSRNSALLAFEYNNSPEYAAQAVLLSTVFSSFTVAFVVYFATILY